MPTPLISRINLDLLYIDFATLFLELLANCQARGHVYEATSGYRSPEEQETLWRKGRSASGAVVRPSQIVTNARFSAHCAGCAADVVAKVDGKVSWDAKDYAVYVEEGQKLGLDMGGAWRTFKDYPHAQLPLLKHAVSLQRLRMEYEAGGTEAVHKFLDGKGPWAKS